MSKALIPLEQLPTARFETMGILKRLATSSRKLAELKGVATTIPNQAILLSSLGFGEAKDSSAIENIVTTHDELFRGEVFPSATSNPATKEVLRYRQALEKGFHLVQQTGLLTINYIIEIQGELENNNAGIRKLPGTSLKDQTGQIVFEPTQGEREIRTLLTDLERFINEPDLLVVDPLIKMALIHHRFETIHPFYDGNGRTGRIINVLYLVKEGLLDLPVLFLSSFIMRSKPTYYHLLRQVQLREDAWEDWILYMLEAVEDTAGKAILTIAEIRSVLSEYKKTIRSKFKFYSQDLINSLFKHPYTTVSSLGTELGVSRVTATKYLDSLSQTPLFHKLKVGNANYYVNVGLTRILQKE